MTMKKKTVLRRKPSKGEMALLGALHRAATTKRAVKKPSKAVQSKASLVVNGLPQAKPVSKPDMIELLQALYSVAYKHTDSFEEQYIGADLAYLMGAIISDNACIWPK